MKMRHFIQAVIGLLALTVIYVIAHLADYVIIYWIYIYIQLFITPLITAISYLFYLFRLSIPYIFMYFFLTLFFNLPVYKSTNFIRWSKYTIVFKALQNNKIFIYLYQYNYVFIVGFNLFLLSIVHYAYVHNQYFYIFFIFLFYVLIWIIIKIKHWVLKDSTLQYKKLNILLNLILIILIGIYASMTMDDLHISNAKLYGFENFWKLIDNKYFIKMPQKDVDWARVFKWSRQTSMNNYMFSIKKTLIKSPYTNNNINDDINQNIFDNLHKMHNDDFKSSHFTNSIYKKFKKIFLIQLHMKSHNFIPVSEITQRHKLFNLLRDPSNIIDLSKYYLLDESIQDTLYKDYLDLINKRCNIYNFTTKKVFLISLYQNKINLKDLLFYAHFDYSLEKKYSLILNFNKNLMDSALSNSLDIEYYNIIFNIGSDYAWQDLKNEIYIILKENKLALVVLSKKFKNIYTFKRFKFSFKEDILSDSDLTVNAKSKAKSFTIPDFKKLKIWRSFKLNYKEFLYEYTKDIRENKNKIFNQLDNYTPKNIKKSSKLVYEKEDLFFVFDEDIAYSLSDDIKLKQVDDLIYDLPLDSADEFYELSDFINKRLEDMINGSHFKAKKEFNKVLINNIEKHILAIQNKKVHHSTFSSFYHEILFLNSNNFFKFILENYPFSRHLLTSLRPFMTFEMWQKFMHKFLNFDLSLSPEKVKYNDLEFNFSLAKDILQNKYDIEKFEMLPDLEGIAGTSYEYTVKYYELMDKIYWHEDQEDLIDWIYEISFKAIVSLMDTVREVKDKENDFLFDMINLYLKEPRYIWVAELFENRGPQETSTKLIKELEQKYQLLYNLIEYNELQRPNLLKEIEVKPADYAFIKDLTNKHIFDFDFIESLNQFDYKVLRDIHVLRIFVDKFKGKIITLYPHLAMDSDYWDEYYFESHIIRLLSESYQYRQRALNFDLGVIGGKGDVCLNHYVFIDDMDLLDDFFEEKFYDKLIFFIDQMDFTMEVDFDNILVEEDFLLYADENGEKFKDFCKFTIDNYKQKMTESHFKLLSKLSDDITSRRAALMKNEIQHDLLIEIQDKYHEEIEIELRNLELSKLPIYDWDTFTFIEENINIIKNENPDLLLRRLDSFNKEMEAYCNKNLKTINNKELYKDNFKKEIQSSDVITMKLLKNNWDDYNYFSNKSDKAMKEWFKKKK
jgi:hypothetical protein